MLMENKLNLKIKEFGLINRADIEINKINVVGGINSSGKSTVSKLLYCYLKSISINKRKYIFDQFYSHVDSLDDNLDDVEEYDDGTERNYEKTLNEYRLFRENFFNTTEEWERDANEYTIFTIDHLIDLINESDSSVIFSEVLDMIISSESLSFGGFHKFSGNSFEISKDDNGKYVYKNILPNDISSNDEQYFKEIFYFDTVSIFELENIFGKNAHIYHLNENLKGTNEVSDELSVHIRSIEDKIRKIIRGTFENRKSIIGENIAFVPSTGLDIHLNNTSSGIKQIGAIQLLLHNNKLIPGTFLIIDEPEVNLHPEWQFKFAEILVILAKELDITIYLNSHSPIFIESIDAFCEFYDMLDSVNYYLTVPSHRYIPFNFKKIEKDELYKIYDNLGKPYDLIDQLRLKKHLGE